MTRDQGDKMATFNYIPDPEIAACAGKLDQAVKNLADSLSLEQVSDLLSSFAKEILPHRFRAINAEEGSVWVVDDAEKNLIPVYNSGKDRDRIVLNFKQPIHQGLISMVYATEMPFVEQDIQSNKQHDGRMDEFLDFTTNSMAVAPFHFGGEIRGVLSAVNLAMSDRPENEGDSDFYKTAIQTLQMASQLLGQLVDHKLMEVALGR